MILFTGMAGGEGKPGVGKMGGDCDFHCICVVCDIEDHIGKDEAVRFEPKVM